VAAGSYDIITVGGGIAACSLARAMAERGAKVVVLEREKQFRDRVRGEAVVSWGVAEASELGICRLLKETCAHDVPYVESGSGSRDLRATTLQQSPLLSFPHQVMQETLLAAAENAGAEVRRGRTYEQFRLGRCRTPLRRTASAQFSRMPRGGELAAHPLSGSLTAISGIAGQSHAADCRGSHTRS
jgi:2-polyprenyl-6-methoxyphenol hydroxylase-like FAD-dependent oxidoreductase